MEIDPAEQRAPDLAPTTNDVPPEIASANAMDLNVDTPACGPSTAEGIRPQDDQNNGDHAPYSEDLRGHPHDGEAERDSDDEETSSLSSEDVTHVAQLKDFTEKLDHAARKMISDRVAPKRVYVFVSYWDEAEGLAPLRTMANKLYKFFIKECKFEGTQYKIPRDEGYSAHDFADAIRKWHNEISDDENALFIMYYGGHAERPKGSSGSLKWMAETRQGSPSVLWSYVFPMVFEKSKCRKIFIFDCCYAGAMIRQMDDSPWKGTCEVLGASHPTEKAVALEKCLFTNAVYKELKSEPYTMLQLRATLIEADKTEHYHLQDAHPYYKEWVGLKPPSVISSVAHAPPVATDSMSNETPKKLRKLTTRILIKVSFLSNASDLLDQWKTWLHFSPDPVTSIDFRALTLAKADVRLESLFDSNSCIAIWTLPLWLWDAMESTCSDGYQPLGIVRSDNHARDLAKDPPDAISVTREESSQASAPPASVALPTGELGANDSSQSFVSLHTVPPTQLISSASLASAKTSANSLSRVGLQKSFGSKRQPPSPRLSREASESPRAPSPVPTKAPALQDDFGLRLEFQPDPESATIADFVFVHGFEGGSQSTWSLDSKPETFWPREWLPVDPDFGGVRIHTFGYKLDWNLVGLFSERLAGLHLANHLSNSMAFSSVRTPIVLIGHSTGGFVIKQACVIAEKDPLHGYFQYHADRLHYYFLGTPHRGSEDVDYAGVIAKMLAFSGDGRRPAATDDKVRVDELLRMNQDFHSSDLDFQMHNFYETKETPRFGLIVDKHSATLGYRNEHVHALDKDHTHLTKFSDQQDPDYKCLREQLARTVAEIRDIKPDTDLTIK